MKNARPQTTETSAPNKRDSITLGSLEAGIQAGEIVGATDYPEADRPLFSSAIGIVLDDMPCVRPTWRTIGEHHVDGIRTRQKMFRVSPRQKGSIDGTLAGLIALASVCAVLLAGGLPT